MTSATTISLPADLPQTASAFARPHFHVAVDGGRLAYWRFGSGPDVVLVHGWPLHAATFRAMVPLLAKNFTLHLFDLPGTGHTVWNGAISLTANAAALRYAIDQLNLSRYALLAHDSGAVIGRLIAADDARVSALIMGNTEIPGHRSRLLEFYVWAAKRALTASLLLSAMRWSPVRRSFLGFGGCFGDPAFVDGEFGDWFVRPLLESREVAAGQLALARNLDFHLIDRLADVHAHIRAPVLCIWGTDDPFFPLAKARSMLEQFPGGADLVEIPRAKLFAHEDYPQLFADHAARFLTGLGVSNSQGLT
jgi:pimeloyl-ACP methyl ester carboxylesterase